MTTDTRTRPGIFEPTSVVVLVVLLGLPFLVAFLGTQWTDTGAGSWYQEIDKPSWTPPGWVFGPVWSALYLAMGVAAYLVWRASGPSDEAVLPLGAWAVQLALNLAWTFLFFGRESPIAGTIDIVLLWLAIIITIFLFQRVSRPAAILMVPYLLWVTFAAALTIEITRLN